MSDRYKVLASTMIAGRYFDEGHVITETTGLSKEDIDAAVKGKFVEKVKAEDGEDVEMTDAAPSLTNAHHTKRVVVAERAEDKKTAQEG